MPKKTKKQKLQTEVRSSQAPIYTLPTLKEIRIHKSGAMQIRPTLPHASAHITNHAQVARDITRITLLSLAAFGIELFLYWAYQHRLG